jgi:putative transcription factor
MICEMCGKEAGETKPTHIEGIQLRLCKECQKFGDKKGSVSKESPTKIVIASRLEQRERRMRTRDVYQEEESWELVDDYADRVRKGREGKGWKQEDLAAKINEKHNVISRVESGSLKPTDDLVRKLEKALVIVLMEKVPIIKSEGKSVKGKSLTLGDLIKKP